MALLIIVSVVWAFSFVLIKGTLAGLDANFVAAVRMVLSLLVFLPFLRVRGVTAADRLRLAGIGAVQFGLMYVAYIASFSYLPAHVVALLTTTTPLFVALFSDALERRFHVVFLAAAVLAVAAGVVVQYPAQAVAAGLRGTLLVQASNVAFAAGQVAYRRLAAGRPEWQDRAVFGWLYAGAALVTVLCAGATTDFAALRLSWVQLATLGYLGLVASGVCFFLWNVGARAVNAGTLAALNNLKIPLGIIASLALLREHADAARLGVAVALMGSAVALCEWQARRPAPRTKL